MDLNNRKIKNHPPSRKENKLIIFGIIIYYYLLLFQYKHQLSPFHSYFGIHFSNLITEGCNGRSDGQRQGRTEKQGSFYNRDYISNLYPLFENQWHCLHTMTEKTTLYTGTDQSFLSPHRIMAPLPFCLIMPVP